MSDDFNRGYREAYSPGAPLIPRSPAEAAGRDLARGPSGGGAGAAAAGGGGALGFFALGILIFALVYTVVVGAMAVPGALLILLLTRAAEPGAPPRKGFREAYISVFQGLFVYAWIGTVLLTIAYTGSRNLPRGDAFTPAAFDRDWVVYGALIVWQPLGLLASASVTNHRLRQKLPMASGYLRALVASFVPVVLAAVTVAIAWFTFVDAAASPLDDYHEAFGLAAALGLMLVLYVAITGVVGTLGILFFNLIDRRGRHSFGSAFGSVFVSVCVFSGAMLTMFCVWPSSTEIVGALLQTMFNPRSRGVPTELALGVIPLLAVIFVAVAASTAVLVVKLGRAYQTAYGVLKAGALATFNGALGVIVLAATVAGATASQHKSEPALPAPATPTPALRTSGTSSKPAVKRLQTSH